MAEPKEVAPSYMQHPKWGVGRVIGSDGAYGEVMFIEEGRKRFAKSFMEQYLTNAAPGDDVVKALAQKCKGLSYLAPGEVQSAPVKAKKGAGVATSGRPRAKKEVVREEPVREEAEEEAED